LISAAASRFAAAAGTTEESKMVALTRRALGLPV